MREAKMTIGYSEVSSDLMRMTKYSDKGAVAALSPAPKFAGEDTGATASHVR
jgi:hypothetical protein